MSGASSVGCDEHAHVDAAGFGAVGASAVAVGELVWVC